MPDLATLLTPENALALLTLTLLEIVLGIDNIVFLAIVTGKLDESQQSKARITGLALAMIFRILLLLLISWIMGLTRTLVDFSILGYEVDISGRDVILLVGGLFLIGKSTFEIHDKLEAEGEHGLNTRRAASFFAVLVQIIILDMIFSLDSVITAVGMAKEVLVMIAAVVIAIGVMMVFAGAISRFVERHPTIKMLALSFLLLIGVMLVVEAFEVHVPKGYIYFAMAFSLFVEMLNIRLRKVSKKKPVSMGLSQPEE